MDSPSFPALNFFLLVALLLLVLVGIAVYFAVRSAGRTELRAWQERAAKAEDEVDKVRSRADRLHDDLDGQLDVVRDLTQKITRLEDRPDLTKLLDMLEKADQRSTERHRQLLEAVERVLNNR